MRPCVLATNRPGTLPLSFTVDAAYSHFLSLNLLNLRTRVLKPTENKSVKIVPVSAMKTEQRYSSANA
jgi:hypothetical protein